MSDSDRFRAERSDLLESVASLDAVRKALATKRTEMKIPYTTDRFIRSAEGAIATALNILNGALRHLGPESDLAALGLERIQK